MKISSGLSTGVKLAGTTITDAPPAPMSQIQPAQDPKRSPERNPEQPDMKTAGIGRKVDIKV